MLGSVLPLALCMQRLLYCVDNMVLHFVFPNFPPAAGKKTFNIYISLHVSLVGYSKVDNRGRL
jgi:hypothetical protein